MPEYSGMARFARGNHMKSIATRRQSCSQVLTFSHGAPTTQILAWDLDYFWDIDSIHIGGLVQSGALDHEPGIDPNGHASPRVDLLAALRAYAILCYHRAHHNWGPAIVEHVKEVGNDSRRLTDVVGRFAIAIADTRFQYDYEMRHLPGFFAQHQDIRYTMEHHNYKQYCAGVGSE